VCGIRPAEPGFRSVRIEPNLADLKWVKGSMPHPQGAIIVELKKNNNTIKGSFFLPAGVHGTFEMFGTSIKLHDGDNPVCIKAGP